VRAVATTAKKDSSSAAVAKANLTPEVAKDLYYDMVLGREFEEMCAQMYYRGKMFGFVHLYSGQEAVSSGGLRSRRKVHTECGRVLFVLTTDLGYPTWFCLKPGSSSCSM
jgi:TPP-dependent pyruvate/acetoin dehydrogenase alpha subunit